ncbi:hypothetical protein HA402_010434 [Bradysia odoriphaga]|nr:hypothetical protein HA402_010434 [Bradysia odoriphaga]
MQFQYIRPNMNIYTWIAPSVENDPWSPEKLAKDNTTNWGSILENVMQVFLESACTRRILLLFGQRSLINYVEINSGTKIRTITDINDIYDTLFIERLKGLRLPDWAEKLHVPPYASCLLFELYEGNGNPYLQLFYRRYLNDNNPQPLFIPDCGLKCPLSSWYEKYKDILPTESFPDECRLRPGETLPPDGNPENNSL